MQVGVEEKNLYILTAHHYPLTLMLVPRSLFSSVSGPTLYFHASFPESLLPRQYPFMYSSIHSSHANDSLQMVVQD